MDFDYGEPVSPSERTKKKEQREWKTFYSKLADFPNSFQLEDSHDEMESSDLDKLEKGLRSALSVGYQTDLETARAKNYLAFLLFCRGHPSEALAMTEEALSVQGDGHNLVSLANKAAILWRKGLRKQAEEEADHLRRLKNDERDFEYLRVKARAELAFCYTRMRPKFSPTAVAIFEEVLVKAREPEIWLWKFGLGLTKRRSLHLMHASMYQNRNITAESFDTLDILKEVINNSSSDNLKAKAYAEIALLIGYTTHDDDLKNRLAHQAGMPPLRPLKACWMAFELDENDNSVLCKIGKILRKAKYFQDSREIMEKALELRPSSTVFHQLGLTYTAIASEKKREENGQPSKYVRTERWRDWGRGSRGRGGRGRGNRGRGENRAFTSTGFQVPTTGNFRLPYGTARARGRWQTPGSRGHQNDRNGGGYWPYQGQGERGVEEFRNMETMFQQMTLAQSQRNSLEQTDGSPDYVDSHIPSDQGYSRADSQTPPSTDFNLAVARVRKAVKSPLKYSVILARSDPFVTEAMKCFEDAFEFSAGTNLQAKYDLALMHRRIGERDKALPLLEEILHSNRERSNYITVNAYEQTGLILKEKCEAEADEQKKNQLESEAESMLYMALTKAASLYSTIPQFQGHIQEMWNSFSELLQEADESDLNAIQKLGKKADLLRLISQNEQSMALLNEIRQMAPDEKQDPLHLKLCVENYVALQEFEKALAFIKLLRCTSKGRATLAQFDEHYELEVRIQAARQALLTGSVFKSKKHFYTAFIDTVMQAQPDSTDTSESDSSDSDPMTWDVMMIYNRREETFVQCRSHAQILERLLRDVFDLRVTVMDDANRLGRANDRDEMVRTMRRSRLVLVLAGSHKICCDMQMLVGQACRPNCNTVTLLTDGDHVPRQLKTHRHMPCPPELFTLAAQQMGVASEQPGVASEQPGVTERVRGISDQVGVSAEQVGVSAGQVGGGPENAGVSSGPMGVGTDQPGRYSEQTVQALCKLFCFLVGKQCI